MKNRKNLVFLFILLTVVSVLLGFFCFRSSDSKKDEKQCVSVNPHRGEISVAISCTGTIEPRNRLEIRPAISGRVEKILVSEGQSVRAGQIVAWMSSEERAALIDAARAQGKDSVRYWEETYKPIPLLSPIGGTVIVRDIEPGQSVTAASAILVISDRLIVRAIVDETDIGKVRIGQPARITLDAYPDVLEAGRVAHISYESKVVNNVTTYEVEVIPDRIPDVFRSGMSANISIIQTEKKNILTLPLSAVTGGQDQSFVYVMDKKTGQKIRKKVVTGISDDANIEIISGISANDSICMASDKLIIPENKSLDSPFIPKRPGKK